MRRDGIGRSASFARPAVSSPPMTRRLFTPLSILSLVLCVATAGLWVRSYWRCDGLLWVGPSDHRSIAWLRGQVLVTGNNVSSEERGFHVYSEKVSPDMAFYGSGIRLSLWNRLGFIYIEEATPTPLSPSTHVIRSWHAFIPFWSICLGFTPGPLYWLGVVSSRRRRRLRIGLCPVCGYDLRASPDRCPECGTVPVGKGAA
jgi:hypothetical protein